MIQIAVAVGSIAPVKTATTPSRCSARLTSIFRMSACAYGERANATCSAPGTTLSSVYLP